jgi:hypothetical protein
MIVTDGRRLGGHGLHPKAGRPLFAWNLLDFRCDGLGFATLAFASISDTGGPGKRKIDERVVDLDPPKLTPVDVKKLKEAEAKASHGRSGAEGRASRARALPVPEIPGS